MDKVYIVYDTEDGDGAYTNFYGVYATEAEAMIKAKIHNAQYTEQSIDSFDIEEYKNTEYCYRFYLKEDEKPNTYYIFRVEKLWNSKIPMYKDKTFSYSFEDIKRDILTSEGKRKNFGCLEMQVRVRTDKELYKLGNIELKQELIKMVNEHAKNFQLTTRNATDFNF